MFLAACSCSPSSRGNGDSASRRDDVEEMGWAFLSLEPYKQFVLWNFCIMGKGDGWENFRKNWKISKSKLRHMILDLQEIATKKGLIPCEESEATRTSMDGS